MGKHPYNTDTVEREGEQGIQPGSLSFPVHFSLHGHMLSMGGQGRHSRTDAGGGGGAALGK